MKWWKRLFGKYPKDQEAAFRQNLETVLKKSDELEEASKLIHARNNIKIRANELAARGTHVRKRLSSTS